MTYQLTGDNNRIMTGKIKMEADFQKERYKNNMEILFLLGLPGVAIKS